MAAQDASTKVVLEAAPYPSTLAERTLEIQKRFRQLAASDPQAALREAETLPDPFSQRVALLTTIRTIAETDPDLALQSIQSVSNPRLHNTLQHIALEAMALREPLHALKVSENLDGAFSAFFATVMRQWSTYAPAQAMAHALARSDPQLRSSGVFYSINNWLVMEPDAAMAWFAANSGALNNGELRLIAMKVAELVPERVNGLRNQLPPAIANILDGVQARSAAQRDPQSAIASLNSTTNKQERAQVIQQLASTFGQQDLAAGVNWLRTLEGIERQQAQQTFYLRWFRRDVDGALTSINGLPDADRLALASLVADRIAVNDPERALDWLLDQPAGAINEQNVMAVVQHWAQRDIDGAILKFSAAQNEAWGSQAIAATMSFLVRMDPTRATRWFDSLTNEAAQASSVGLVASGMLSQDADSARNWIETLAPDLRDSALIGATYNANVPPQTSFDIAQGINDPIARNNALVLLINRVARTNPTQALEFAESADLPSETVSRIRQRLGAP